MDALEKIVASVGAVLKPGEVFTAIRMIGIGRDEGLGGSEGKGALKIDAITGSEGKRLGGFDLKHVVLIKEGDAFLMAGDDATNPAAGHAAAQCGGLLAVEFFDVTKIGRGTKGSPSPAQGGDDEVQQGRASKRPSGGRILQAKSDLHCSNRMGCLQGACQWLCW